MTINFDVISDLYLDSNISIDWSHKVTSLFCIVAGNISADHAVLEQFLTHLSSLYRGVFFIDGDLEHDTFNGEFYLSYKSLSKIADAIENVFFLHENIVILEHVVLVGSNGWTSFDFSDLNSFEDNVNLLVNTAQMDSDTVKEIYRMGISDTHYLGRSINSCQNMEEIKEILIITNSVPKIDLVKHNENYNNTLLGNTCGNTKITSCLMKDIESKAKSWIFGKYPYSIDRTIGTIRFISNPAIGTDLEIYYPKIIKFS